MAAGAFVFFGLISVFLGKSAAPEPERRPSTAITSALTNARIAVPSAAVSRQVRPAKVVYRNSVLPGGVGSAVELTAALAHDSVAAAHYTGFNVAAARTVQVERSRMVYVSYRIGDKIYWTRKPVRLALGETLLSDGEHLARARCGNRIADQAQSPVLLTEPAAEVLEMAFVSAESLIDAPSDVAPRANGAATAQSADAQQATPTRSMPFFAFSLDAGLLSPPAIDARTQILALAPPPVTAPPAKTTPRPSTPDSPPPKSPPPDSPPPKSPPPDSPPPKSPPPDSPPPKSPPEKSPPPDSPPPDSPTPPSPPPPTPEPGPNPRLNVPPRAPTPIPEPKSAALLGLGLAIFLLMRSRGRQRQVNCGGRRTFR